MITWKVPVKTQVKTLLETYPNLRIIKETPEEIRLSGSIFVFVTAKDYTVRQTYILDIIIPLSTDALPRVIDTGHHIKTSYPHYYKTGELCLATAADIRIRYIDGFDLVRWMQDYVETYYFSYEYYQRYGVFPFGERAHGVEGILETYREQLKTKDLTATFGLMRHICRKPYRGHQMCPCGSGLKIRNCHGGVMKTFYQDSGLYHIICQDLVTIEKGG